MNRVDDITFLVDAMLGRLAKHLLHAGFNVQFHSQFDDEELIEISNREKRILLSRDRDLIDEYPGMPKRIFVFSSGTLREYLTALKQAYSLRFEQDHFFSRCSKCNRALKSVPKDNVEEQIPKGTSEWIEEYFQCPECGKVYWQGSHYREILEKFRKWNLL